MSKRVYVTADEIGSCATDRSCQETNISWVRDDEKISIETSDNTFITKMKNTMQRDPDHYSCYYYEGNVGKETGKVFAYIFETDKKLLNFRVNQKKRDYTEEEKKEMRERLKKKNI